VDHAAIAAAIGRPLTAAPSRVEAVLHVALDTIRTAPGLPALAVGVIDLLAGELQDAVDDLAAVRTVLSELLTLAHQQELTMKKQRCRIAELLARGRR